MGAPNHTAQFPAVFQQRTKMMSQNRRQFLMGAASLAFAYGVFAPHAFSQENKATRIILLGTKGGPRVGAIGRKNPSTLILINAVPYVVDCGYGTSQQLVAAGVPLNKL